MRALQSAMAVLTLAVESAVHAAPAVFAPDGVAIRGYDPVAYFLDAKPIPGRDDYTADWNGARWKFASAAHRDLFTADPAKYAPQYGGYCAYGTAKGHLAPTQPAAWAVVDGKLYLNYDERVRRHWQADTPGYRRDADAVFGQLLAGPAEGE